MMRKTLLALWASLLLAGCGSNTVEMQSISFDDFTVQIAANYQEIDANLLQQNSLIKPLISAYQWNSEIVETLPWSFFVARELLKGSHQQFIQASIQQNTLSLPGYTHINTKSMSFGCLQTQIQGTSHIFGLVDEEDETQTHYIGQFLFTKSRYGYILSEASTDLDYIESFTTRLKTLNCGETLETPQS